MAYYNILRAAGAAPHGARRRAGGQRDDADAGPRDEGVEVHGSAPNRQSRGRGSSSDSIFACGLFARAWCLQQPTACLSCLPARILPVLVVVTLSGSSSNESYTGRISPIV